MRTEASLTERATFQRRAAGTDDGYGNTVGDWDTVAIRTCSLKPTRGREEIVAARLQGTASWDLWVPYESALAALSTDDRVLDARDTTKTYNIRFGPADMDGTKTWLFLQLEAGVADG